jgi:hypothetical protein
MIKSFLIISSVIVLTLFSGFFKQTSAEELKIEGKNIVYTLPYSGILPDNPLYPVKIVRDRFLEFFTRDYYKKAQIYLLFSDKRVSMSIGLADKGKWAMATSTLNKAEIYTQKTIDLAITSRKQGVAFPQEFIDKMRQSNQKHLEVIEDLLKDAPQQEQQNLQQSIKINKQNKDRISSI